MRTKLCLKCSEDKPLSEMVKLKKDGKLYHRSLCLECNRKIQREKRRDHPNAARWNARHNKRNRERRRDPGSWHLVIWKDARASDRKAGRENNLTKEFIAEKISKGCSYCGERELRMTLDRIDNEKGHTQENVVSACIRCNYVRKNMPYEAWVVVARAMTRARTQGLFGDWTGRVR